MLLSNVHGRKVLTGTDAITGKIWRQFELDYLFDSTRGRCSICNEELAFGWEDVVEPQQQVCDNEIVYAGMRSYLFPEELLGEDVIENNWWN